MSDRLNPGQQLTRGERITSQDGRYSLLMQDDANLVFYDGGNPLWATGTTGTPAQVAIMQADGNLVVYGSDGGVYWALDRLRPRPVRIPGAVLIAQNDGNLVIYAPNSQPIWAWRDGAVLMEPGFTTDGNRAVYPIKGEGYYNANPGYAWVELGPSGHFSVRVKGKHSGVTGNSRYSICPVAVGYKNGQANTILNAPQTRTLTVGAEPDGSATKEATFADFPPVPPEDLPAVRFIWVLFSRNKSNDNFKDTLTHIIRAAGEVFSEADVQYKKFVDSDLGQAIIAAVAAA